MINSPMQSCCFQIKGALWRNRSVYVTQLTAFQVLCQLNIILGQTNFLARLALTAVDSGIMNPDTNDMIARYTVRPAEMLEVCDAL